MACSQHPKSCQHTPYFLLAFLLLSFLGRAAREPPKLVLSPRNQASTGASPPPHSLPSSLDSCRTTAQEPGGLFLYPNFTDIS